MACALAEDVTGFDSRVGGAHDRLCVAPTLEPNTLEPWQPLTYTRSTSRTLTHWSVRLKPWREIVDAPLLEKMLPKPRH